MRGTASRTSPAKSPFSFLAYPSISDYANYTRRHLLRLWLRDPENAWPTPERLQDRWDTLYKDVTEEEQVFPQEPTL